MIFQMQEGYLTLQDGGWQDHSINMLAAKHLPTDGVNLVVTREALPAGVSLSDYIINQKLELGKAMKDLKLITDQPDIVDSKNAHFLEFTWKNENADMHQMILVIHHDNRVLNLTATIPGIADEKSRTELFSAMQSFTFGPAPMEKDHQSP